MILGNFNYVGVGAKTDDAGTIWMAIILMRGPDDLLDPPDTTTTTTTQPPPTTTTTTQPPGTTTTTEPPWDHHHDDGTARHHDHDSAAGDHYDDDEPAAGSNDHDYPGPRLDNDDGRSWSHDEHHNGAASRWDGARQSHNSAVCRPSSLRLWTPTVSRRVCCGPMGLAQ